MIAWRVLRARAQLQIGAAATATGAACLDLTPYLCNGGACPVTIGRLVVYRVGHHLAAFFSEKLAVPLWQWNGPALR